jgi:hypothetical protein
MSDDRFLDQLRGDAARLRYEPRDEHVWTRLAARVRDRIARAENVPQMLAGWFRPIATFLFLLAIGAGLTVAWVDRQQPVYAVENIASHPVEITVDGDTFNLAE